MKANMGGLELPQPYMDDESVDFAKEIIRRHADQPVRHEGTVASHFGFQILFNHVSSTITKDLGSDAGQIQSEELSPVVLLGLRLPGPSTPPKESTDDRFLQSMQKDDCLAALQPKQSLKSL